MMFALVQKNLEQKIERQALEEASVHVPSVARGDCAYIARQLFGVVVENLPREEAVAFQVALEHFGFSTDLVPQEELPLLPEPKFRRGIHFHEDGFTALDGLGREDPYPWGEVQFAAGGFLAATRLRTENSLEWNYHSSSGRGSVGKTVQVAKRAQEVKEKEFRLELFLSCEPFRLQFQAGKETLFRFDGRVLRFRQENQFVDILQRVAGMLPRDCLSLGILAACRGESFLYPSIAALEEEVIWQLFQRVRG